MAACTCRDALFSQCFADVYLSHFTAVTHSLNDADRIEVNGAVKKWVRKTTTGREGTAIRPGISGGYERGVCWERKTSRPHYLSYDKNNHGQENTLYLETDKAVASEHANMLWRTRKTSRHRMTHCVNLEKKLHLTSPTVLRNNIAFAACCASCRCSTISLLKSVKTLFKRKQQAGRLR